MTCGVTEIVFLSHSEEVLQGYGKNPPLPPLPAAPAVRSMAAWMAGLDFMALLVSVEGDSLEGRMRTTYPWEEAKIQSAQPLRFPIL